MIEILLSPGAVNYPPVCIHRIYKMDRIEYAKQFIGTPYKWGGNSPLEGLDCSALICEVLRAENVIGAREDLNSQMLFDRFYMTNNLSKNPSEGDLLFFGKDKDSITHVALALNDFQMIESGGGNSTTTTLEAAVKRNAMVRVRPISDRSDFVAAVEI